MSVENATCVSFWCCFCAVALQKVSVWRAQATAHCWKYTFMGIGRTGTAGGLVIVLVSVVVGVAATGTFFTSIAAASAATVEQNCFEWDLWPQLRQVLIWVCPQVWVIKDGHDEKHILLSNGWEMILSTTASSAWMRETCSTWRIEPKKDPRRIELSLTIMIPKSRRRSTIRALMGSGAVRIYKFSEWYAEGCCKFVCHTQIYLIHNKSFANLEIMVRILKKNLRFARRFCDQLTNFYDFRKNSLPYE